MSVRGKETGWKVKGKCSPSAHTTGGYCGWIKQRKVISPYRKLPQQARVGSAGREFGRVCRGLRKPEITACRAETMRRIFHPDRPPVVDEATYRKWEAEAPRRVTVTEEKARRRIEEEVKGIIPE